jgi:hypothetical protein
MFEGTAAQILKWVPSIAPFLASYYTCGFFAWAVEPESATITPGAESTGRMGYLMAVGYPLALCLCAFHSPLQLLSVVRFWRPILLGISIVTILLSGFRSAIAGVFGFFMVSAYVRRGKGELARMIFAGGLALALVVVCQGTFFELPRSAQRALSFLPGRWEPYAKLEAEASTQWRTEMWKEMLTTNRFIENHLLGDGFGFKKRDLELMLYYKKYGDASAGQESFMISGAVHSGPVSTVRFVGYTGLSLTMIILVGMAWTGWKLIQRAKGTPLFPLTLFICIPAVIEPFYFTFIFGGFENTISDGLFTLGMLRMLRNSLDDHATAKLPVLPLGNLSKAQVTGRTAIGDVTS